MDPCPICQKHKGLGEHPAPPGGCSYEDEHWMVCHAPPNLGPLGTLFIESRRHFLNFAEFDEREQATYGIVAHKVTAALKQLIDPTRVYHLSTVGGLPHFHVWLVARARNIPERALKFLARDDTCDQADAAALAVQLGAVLNPQSES